MLPLLAVVAIGLSVAVDAAEPTLQEELDQWVLMANLEGLSFLDDSPSSSRYALVALVQGRISSLFLSGLREAIQDRFAFEAKQRAEPGRWHPEPATVLASLITAEAKRSQSSPADRARGSADTDQWTIHLSWDFPTSKTAIVKNMHEEGVSLRSAIYGGRQEATLSWDLVFLAPDFEFPSDTLLVQAFADALPKLLHVAVASGLFEELFQGGAPGRLKRGTLRRIDKFLSGLRVDQRALLVGYMATHDFDRFATLLQLSDIEAFVAQWNEVESRVRSGWLPLPDEVDSEVVKKTVAQASPAFF